MRIAVTVTAMRRPVHLARALRSIDITSTVWMGSAINPWVSVDYFDEDSIATLQVARDMGLEDKVRLNNPPKGLWTNPNNASDTYDWVFRQTEVEAILAIEDDAVLSPDALDLCSWFLENGRQYLFCSLGNCNRPEATVGKELDLVERPMIDSPWAWFFRRSVWKAKIRPVWQSIPADADTHGWDWSLTKAMHDSGWKALNPVLARAKNIGRDLGENGGSDIFDETLAKAAVSDGTFGSDWRIVR